MVDLTREIAKILEGIAPVELAGSERELMLPMIFIQQAANVTSVSFDDADFLTESRYQIDIYAETPQKCIEMAKTVDKRMQSEGWQRVSGQLLGLQRFVTMYKALVTEDKHTYQN